MRSSVDLTLFAHVAARPEAQIDLAQAALLIADSEPRGVDVSRSIAALDELGKNARREIARASAVAGHILATPSTKGRPIEHLLRWMYVDVGFHGNTADYFDPNNSFLDQVIERRTGIPITLAVVLMEIGRRVGLDIHGVSFPGHFLVRHEGPEGPMFVDPFDGRVLAQDDLRALFTRATGQASAPDPRMLESASKRQILVRMLNNLRGIYANRGDRDRLRGVLERMEVLAPSEEIRRALEELGGTTPWPSGGFTLH